MTVALVVAVLVALVAVVALVLQQRRLRTCRAQLEATEARAATAEVEARETDEARAAAEARVSALDAANETARRTGERRGEALAVSERARTEAEAALQGCTAEAARAQEELGTARSLVEGAEAATEAERARGAELEAAAASAQQRVDEGERALAGALEERAALERLLAQLRATTASASLVQPRPGGDGPAALDPAAAVEASWRLLLARVERQWASSVGAGQEERGVVPAQHDEQLHQAVARELERLREEVGLHTEVTRTGTMDGVHPLVVLLAAGELTALVAPHSERVAVELGDRLVVVGEGWSPEPAAGEHLRGSVSDTGLDGEVVATDDSVRIVVGPPRGAPTP